MEARHLNDLLERDLESWSGGSKYVRKAMGQGTEQAWIQAFLGLSQQ